jgi:hypothetical protein
MIVGMRRAQVGRFMALIAAVTLGLTSCAAGSPESEPSGSRGSAPAESPEPSPPATSEPVSADALAERDAFFAAQGQPPGDSLPTPQTPEQQEFLAQQRAYVESQGGTWDAFYDGVALAVTLDACETSILNGHQVDADTARLHIESSPLIEQIAAGDADAVQGLASILVFGTGFVCPADAPQWEAAYTALYQ